MAALNRYVTYGDKLASENPFFYCEECYRPLHYSVRGTLLYSDYQVYQYGQTRLRCLQLSYSFTFRLSLISFRLWPWLLLDRARIR
jgi:hypothetical protein